MVVPSNPSAPAEHHEPNLVRDWLVENRVFLVVLVLAFLLIAFLQQYLPERAARAQQEAWNQFDNLIGELSRPLAKEDIAALLAEAEGYPDMYPWVLLRASQEALRRDDHAALAVVQPALASMVAARPDLAAWTLRVAGEERPLFSDVALASLQSEEAWRKDNAALFRNPSPQPDSPRVELQLRGPDGEEHVLAVALYPEVAPRAVEQFLAWCESGDLSALAAARVVGPRLVFEPTELADATQPLERSWGYFHLVGALSTELAPAATDRSQRADTFTICLKSQPQLDGGRSVFGQIVGADAILDDLSQLATDPAQREQPQVELLSATITRP